MWLIAVGAFLTIPFVSTVRVAVLGHSTWGVSTVPALVIGVSATLLGALALVLAGARGGGGTKRRLLAVRSTVLLGVACTLHAGVAFWSAATLEEDQRQRYRSLHPLLRAASRVVILTDREALMPPEDREVEDFPLLGLWPEEGALHLPDETGWVRAVDVRTSGRSELQSRLFELYFWLLGFHSQRLRGTADHLHVSLRPPQ